MKTRVISGRGIVAVLTLIVILYNSIFSNIVILWAYFISLKEIRNAFSENNSNACFIALAIVGTYYIFSGYLGITLTMAPIVLLMVSYAFVTVFNFEKIDVKSVSSSYMYGLYSMVGFYSLSMFKTILPFSEHGYDASFMFAMCILVAWVGDSSAYFSGYLFGKHKMSPKLSPKKTVEGAIGGLLFSGLGAIFLVYVYKLLKQFIFNEIYTISIRNIGLWMFVGVAGYAFAMIGDLFASAIKRQVGIKDYSNLIPGHGGILDRFDSVIIISPAFTLIASYIALHGGIFNV